MIRQVLASSRYFVAAAVIGSFVAAVVLIVSGVIAVVQISWDVLRHPATDVAEAKHLAVDFMQLIDVFLLWTALYIIALGLYELFVDPELPMPSWLRIHDFDHLEEKLISVIIVLLAVTFLGSAVSFQSGDDILEFGAAIGIVIVALSFALFIAHRSPGSE